MDSRTDDRAGGDSRYRSASTDLNSLSCRDVRYLAASIQSLDIQLARVALELLNQLLYGFRLDGQLLAGYQVGGQREAFFIRFRHKGEDFLALQQ